MSLQDQLKAIRDGAEKRIPAAALEIMHGATRALQQSGAAERVIRTGAALPPFELPNQRGAIVRSADVLGRGPLVLTVYRGIW
jgi:hypothetical protein